VSTLQANHLYAGPLPANTKPGSISRSVIQAPAAAPAGSAAKGEAAKSPRQDGRRAGAGVPQAPAGSGEGREGIDQKSAEVQRKEENCRHARERLAQYDIAGAMTRINPQGERYYLEDAQIEQEKARARTTSPSPAMSLIPSRASSRRAPA